MDNNTISLQELLDCISRLRDDVNALTVAFSYLTLSIPREQMQPTLASLLLESRNPKWSQEQQNSFKWLVALLEEKYAGKITISVESSENQ
ncbi:TPA: hypothetical protein JLR35_002966 [Escherichia coli]|nr:hypothetical protein [Escherichia coli]HAV8523822.1 hypothetical protein [Escherichia coli]HAW0414101.1 hypothetical protein [Escherichia coli]HAW0428148.1 hypothetical protein [Escherichia coli]HAW3013674.1 hypothetical protein [Escherichia coli]